MRLQVLRMLRLISKQEEKILVHSNSFITGALFNTPKFSRKDGEDIIELDFSR